VKIAVRTDASVSMGTGHVIRCLTLAEELRAKGHEVLFVCREHEGHLCDVIHDRGVRVVRLPAAAAASSDDSANSEATWLGVPWETDARDTRAAISADWEGCDLLVVDHYAIDHRWESTLRSEAERIMVIDDLANRTHDCDVLLDQNLVEDRAVRYEGIVPRGCIRLLGPRYALLQSIYAELHERMSPRAGAVRRILISFGGADNERLTERTLDVFLRLNRPDIEVDVVGAANWRGADATRRRVTGVDNVYMHIGAPTLGPMIARADLAIGAAGATSYERLCLGLPALVVTLAENQRAVAEELNRRGLIHWLGPQQTADRPAIERALTELLDSGLDEAWSRRCLAMVDGQGTKRVCAVLTVTASTPLRMRHAGLKDETVILEWANDATTRRNAFSSEAISEATHRRWFRDRLRDPDGCRFYVGETADGVALGQVRFDGTTDAWEIDYTVAPEFRGRGLGRALLEAGLVKLRKDTNGGQVLGRVKCNNGPSLSVFKALGFEARTAPNGIIECRRAI
jgi:UDP-2,4-diacetamido-2,4,6-trideoxy-beta-L-altropyranose hydrolase